MATCYTPFPNRLLTIRVAAEGARFIGGTIYMDLDLVGKLHRNFCSPRFQESAFRENLVSLPPSSLTLWFKITVGKGEEEEEGDIGETLVEDSKKNLFGGRSAEPVNLNFNGWPTTTFRRADASLEEGRKIVVSSIPVSPRIHHRSTRLETSGCSPLWPVEAGRGRSKRERKRGHGNC